MFRRTLITAHLFLAAFLAPMFILVAISGGLYLIDQEGSVTRSKVALPANTKLDFQSETLEEDVRMLFKELGIDYKFDSLRSNATRAITRPTSRASYAFGLSDGALTLTRNEPDLQRKMIELHKGHGPRLYILYQKLSAIGLLLVVLSGFWLGVSSRALRTKSLLISVGGLIAFITLGFLM